MSNSQHIRVFVEKRLLAKHIATFTDEEAYIACVPAIEAYARAHGWDRVTESCE